MGYLDKKIHQVQSVIDFMEDPCEAPWMVYAELALPPLGDAIITLLAFGLDDVVRGYFRPKGLYRRQRIGKLARRFGKYALPELGELIGSNLPGAKPVHARNISQGARLLWLADGVLQRIFFYWLIIDVVSDFAYAWTSSIAQTEYCREQRLSGACQCAVAANAVPPIDLEPDGNPQGCDPTQFGKAWGTFLANGVTIVPTSFFGAELHMIGFPNASPGDLLVWVAPTGRPHQRVGEIHRGKYNQSTHEAQVVFRRALPAEGHYTVYAACEGPYVGIIDRGTLFGFAYGPPR